MPRYGDVIGKTLELLAAGLLLGFVRDKKERRKLLEECDYVWHTIDQKKLNRVLKKLRIEGLIKSAQQGKREKFSLTSEGRRKFLRYKFYNLRLARRKRWDRKWRIVLFDIPEARRKIRDALRNKLKNLGFFEFQKSVFIFPYPCSEEINFVMNFFDIADHVYCLEAPITPDDAFRLHFRLE